MRPTCKISDEAREAIAVVAFHLGHLRTFEQWDEQVPGFVEADLVAHCGSSVEGSYLFALTLTNNMPQAGRSASYCSVRVLKRCLLPPNRHASCFLFLYLAWILITGPSSSTISSWRIVSGNRSPLRAVAPSSRTINAMLTTQRHSS